MSYLKPMSDWCMAKDYNGAERFADGSKPLMAEVSDCDIVVSGYDLSGKNDKAWIYVSFATEDWITGLADSKAKGIELGELIAEFINKGTTKADFEKFFRSLSLSEINAENYKIGEDADV